MAEKRKLTTSATKQVAERAKAAPRALVEERKGGMYFADAKTDVKFVPTGCTTLDLAMGGGWVFGRIGNIVGDKSSGKTLMMIEATANYAKLYPKHKIRYWETEAAFDPGYAKALGMPVGRIDFGPKEKGRTIMLETVEDLFERLEDVVNNATGPELIIVDSLDALSDRKERSRGLDEGSYGGDKAKMLSRMFRELTGRMEEIGITLLIVSQLRDNVGAMFGEKHKRSGGRALDFYCTHVIWLAHIGRLTQTFMKQKRATGVIVKAQVKKNKISLPFRSAEFDIRFGYGTDDAQACVDWLKNTSNLKDVDLIRVKGETDPTKFYLDKLHETCTPDEEREHMAMLRAAVAKRWYEIERSTLPTRGKY